MQMLLSNIDIYTLKVCVTSVFPMSAPIPLIFFPGRIQESIQRYPRILLG